MLTKDDIEALSAGAGQSPQALFEAIAQVAARRVNAGLVTAMRHHAAEQQVERLYSSNTQAYPVGGRKQKRDTGWSRKVLDHLLATGGDGPARVMLLGNHDLWLREFTAAEVTDPEQTASWMRFGGDATLLSYGVKLDLRKPQPDRFDAARRELQDRFPPAHAALLGSLDLAFGFGDYFFCHAGIRPDTPLERQSEADLLWIRETFLSWAGEWGKIVVHGHTVEEAPVTRVNRIGIDTGACWTGKLTCLVLAGTERRFLQTGS